jgi:hypothetical protein
MRRLFAIPAPVECAVLLWGPVVSLHLTNLAQAQERAKPLPFSKTDDKRAGCLQVPRGAHNALHYPGKVRLFHSILLGFALLTFK